MKIKLTIKSEATVLVPAGNWLDILACLALHHQERFKSYATMFVTDTRRCNLGELAIRLTATPKLNAKASSHRWLQSLIMELGVFDGDLIFKAEE
jgi:hypothetical protein